MMEKSTPSLSQELVELQCASAFTSSNTVVSDKELALVVKSNEEASVVYTNSNRSNMGVSTPKLLDLNSVDILGSGDAVKKLFALSCTDKSPVLALHKVGGTLLIDSINGEEFGLENSNRSFSRARDVQFGRKGQLSNESPKESATSEALQLYQHGRDSMLVADMLGGTEFDTLFSNQKQASDNVALVAKHESTSDSVLRNSMKPLQKDVLVPLPLTSGSPYVPPPTYFMPSVPPPNRNLLSWNFHEMRIAVGVDFTVYKMPDDSSLALKSLDATREVEASTCLDYYLDNVMANVPQLALALHAKGFVRGLRVCSTGDIPHLNNSDVLSSSMPNVSNVQFYNNSTRVGELYPEEEPLFDPKTIDFDATAILRFLKENCRRDDATYILCRSSTEPESLQLYDLSLASLTKQRKFKWMLAMLSYRFSMRLAQHANVATKNSKMQMRLRQLSLLRTCNQMLTEIKDMGGESHDSIRAAVLEQMADTHLAAVDERNLKRKEREMKETRKQTINAIGKNQNDNSFSNSGEPPNGSPSHIQRKLSSGSITEGFLNRDHTQLPTPQHSAISAEHASIVSSVKVSSSSVQRSMTANAGNHINSSSSNDPSSLNESSAKVLNSVPSFSLSNVESSDGFGEHDDDDNDMDFDENFELAEAAKMLKLSIDRLSNTVCAECGIEKSTILATREGGISFMNGAYDQSIAKHQNNGDETALEPSPINIIAEQTNNYHENVDMNAEKNAASTSRTGTSISSGAKKNKKKKKKNSSSNEIILDSESNAVNESVGVKVGNSITTQQSPQAMQSTADTTNQQSDIPPQVNSSTSMSSSQTELTEGNHIAQNEENEKMELQEEDEDEDESSAELAEALTLQLAGTLHKLIQAKILLVVNCLRSAKISYALELLYGLISPSLTWTALKGYLRTVATRHGVDTSDAVAQSPSVPSVVMPLPKEDEGGIWGANMTIFQSLAALWDILGELCRETWKQTTGISLHDAEIVCALQEIVSTWIKLTHSVVSNCSSAFSAVPRIALAGTGNNLNSSDPTEPISTPNTSYDTPTAAKASLASVNFKSSLSASTLRKKKSKMRKASENSHRQLVLLEIERYWSVLAGALHASEAQLKLLVSTAQQHSTTASPPQFIVSSTHIDIHDSTANTASETQFGASNVSSSKQYLGEQCKAILAMRSLHSILAPIAAMHQTHLNAVDSTAFIVFNDNYNNNCIGNNDDRGDMSVVNDGSKLRSSSIIASMEINSSMSSLSFMNLATNFKAVASIPISVELQGLIRTTYCFICSAILYHHKACGGLRSMNATQSSHNYGKTNNNSNKGKKCKIVTLRTGDMQVQENIRRLADCSNSLAKQLLALALQLKKKSESTYQEQMSSISLSDNTGDSSSFASKLNKRDADHTQGKNDSTKTEEIAVTCISLAQHMFLCSRDLFSITNDAANYCMVQCNLSSLLRVLASWSTPSSTLVAACTAADANRVSTSTPPMNISASVSDYNEINESIMLNKDDVLTTANTESNVISSSHDSSPLLFHEKQYIAINISLCLHQHALKRCNEAESILRTQLLPSAKTPSVDTSASSTADAPTVSSNSGERREIDSQNIRGVATDKHIMLQHQSILQAVLREKAQNYLSTGILQRSMQNIKIQSSSEVSQISTDNTLDTSVKTATGKVLAEFSSVSDVLEEQKAKKSMRQEAAAGIKNEVTGLLSSTEKSFIVQDMLQNFEKALAMFEALHNDRQSAAVHFQLGQCCGARSFEMQQSLALQSESSDSALDMLHKSFHHYQEAHRYYSKYDIGPTLGRILLDMADLYLSCYASSEKFFNAAASRLQYIIATRVKTNSKAHSLSSPSISIQTSEMNSKSPILASSPPLVQSNVIPDGNDQDTTEEDEILSISQQQLKNGNHNNDEEELVAATKESAGLLGGVYHAVLEVRFALTEAVTSKYGAEATENLAYEALQRLTKLLLYVLKLYKKLDTCTATSARRESNSNVATPSAESNISNQLLTSIPLVQFASVDQVSSLRDMYASAIQARSSFEYLHSYRRQLQITSPTCGDTDENDRINPTEKIINVNKKTTENNKDFSIGDIDSKSIPEFIVSNDIPMTASTPVNDDKGGKSILHEVTNDLLSGSPNSAELLKSVNNILESLQKNTWLQQGLK